MGEDSPVGLSVSQQFAMIAVVGVVLVVASDPLSSAIDSTDNPTVFGIGLVCLLYAAGRGAYEVLVRGYGSGNASARASNS